MIVATTPNPRRLQRRNRSRALTLLEVMVSIAVLSMLSLLIYGALDNMEKTKKGVGRVSERYREGRIVIRRMANELAAAFISGHQPFNIAMSVRTTAFIGTNSTPADRLDFASFSHVRVQAESHESDQCEISYFGSTDPDVSGKTDLARRDQTIIDYDPKKGGKISLLAENIDLFDLRYMDPMTGLWQDTWDSTQATGQLARLPLFVKITLVLRDGESSKNIPFVASVPINIQNPLRFAVQQ